MLRHIYLVIIFCCALKNLGADVLHTKPIFHKKEYQTAYLNNLLEKSRLAMDKSIIESINLGKLLVQKLEKKGSIKDRALAYRHLGFVYYLQGNCIAAINKFEKALNCIEKTSDSVQMADIYICMGITYKRKGQIYQAVNNLAKAVDIIKDIHFNKRDRKIFKYDGDIYSSDTDYSYAIKLYHKALNFTCSDFSHLVHNTYLYNEIGSLYLKLRKPDSAFLYLNKSNVELKKSKNNYFKASTDFYLGKYYKLKNEKDSSLFYFKKTYNISKSIGYNSLYAESAIELSNLYLDIDNRKVNKYLEGLECISKSYGIPSIDKERMEVLLKLELSKRSSKYSALFSDYLELTDSINRYYDVENYERAMLRVLIGDDINDTKNEMIKDLKSDKINISCLLTIILLILGIVTIIIMQRTANLKIGKKNLNLQHKIMLAQLNPHFLFNSLNAIQSFILKEMNEDANHYLTQVSRLLRNTIENSRKEYIKLSDEIKSLEQYVKLQKLRFGDSIKYIFDIDESIDKYNIMTPPIMVQSFIENTLVLSNLRSTPNAYIKIKFRKSEDEKFLIYSIEDNGSGIPDDLKTRQKYSSFALAEDRIKIYNLAKRIKMKISIIDKKTAGEDETGIRMEYRFQLMTEADI